MLGGISRGARRGVVVLQGAGLAVVLAAAACSDSSSSPDYGLPPFDGGATPDAAPQPRPIKTPLQGLGFSLGGGENAVVGTKFTAQMPLAGGKPPYTAKMKAGSTLPDGLTLDATGRLTGTPTTAGNYDVFYEIDDSAGASMTNEVKMSVVASGTAPPPFVIQAKPPPLFGQDQDVGYQPLGWGSDAPWTFTVTGLPPGLVFDPATGTISGKTSATGMSTITISASDANGKPAAGSPVTFTMNVSPPVVPMTGTETWIMHLPGATDTTLTVHGGAISQVSGTEWMWKNPAGDCSYAVAISGQVAGDQWQVAGETIGGCSGQMTQCFGQGSVTVAGHAQGMITCNTTYPSLPADSNTGPWTADRQP